MCGGLCVEVYAVRCVCFELCTLRSVFGGLCVEVCVWRFLIGALCVDELEVYVWTRLCL